MALFEIDTFQITFSASEGVLIFFFFLFLLVLFVFCFVFFVFVFLSLFSTMLSSSYLLNLIPTLMVKSSVVFMGFSLCWSYKVCCLLIENKAT